MLNGLDLDLFKQKAIAGEYKNRVQVIDGRNFDIKFFRLSPDVYLDWFQEYIFQRGEAFVQSNSKNKVSEAISNPKHIEILKEFADKAAKPKTPETKPMEETKEIKQAKELQKWIEREFYKEWERQGHTHFERNCEPYIIYKQSSHVKSDYVKRRFEEIHKELGMKFQEGQGISLVDFGFNEIQKLINGNNAY